ncbi:hypothetical protein GCM10023195_38670 [Actinoallomurus liliacearum]|uniref:Uncharacterized protein n=1 Tax=Actinoallomurus liliacearum TaxID=1080073 RepID=A0ABP8TMT9_9ACTN
MTEPHGLINGILYATQFERTLDDEVVGRIARALLEEPILHLTPEQEYEGIVAGLRSEEPLTGQIPQPHDEEAVREFLGKVVRRLDALRPWPELPIATIGPEHWTEFGGARPIARVQVPILDVQGRLRTIFHRLDDGHDILLLRLRSGAEVALITPWWVGSDDSALLLKSQDVPAPQVIEEFGTATGWGPDDVAPLP